MERKRESIQPQTHSPNGLNGMAEGGPGKIQKPGTSLASLMEVIQAQALGPSSVAFACELAGLEAEQLELELCSHGMLVLQVVD